MEQITVKSCVEKKKTDSYTIYGVEDVNGKKYDCFTLLAEGEVVNAEVIPNGNYAPRLKVIKDKKGGGAWPQKDYTYDKRRSALDLTIQLIVAGKLEIEKLNTCRDKFYEYLNQK